MRVLVAGPWVGEFGWEIFAWQGYVRALSKDFDRTIVISKGGTEDLYSDFASEYLTFNPKTGRSDSFFMNGYQFNREDVFKVLRENDVFLDNHDVILFFPRRIGFPPNTHFSEPAQIREGLYLKPEYAHLDFYMGNASPNVLIHARNRQLRSQDNWPVEKWDKLVSFLKEDGYEVDSIGTKEESHHIKGTRDLRGIDMHMLLTGIGNADYVFGPSSGPMHLASLVGVPHVVWSKEGNRTRYEKNWNPWNAPVLFLSEHSWQPEPEYVFEKFKEWKK